MRFCVVKPNLWRKRWTQCAWSPEARSPRWWAEKSVNLFISNECHHQDSWSNWILYGSKTSWLDTSRNRVTASPPPRTPSPKPKQWGEEWTKNTGTKTRWKNFNKKWKIPRTKKQEFQTTNMNKREYMSISRWTIQRPLAGIACPPVAEAIPPSFFITKTMLEKYGMTDHHVGCTNILLGMPGVPYTGKCKKLRNLTISKTGAWSGMLGLLRESRPSREDGGRETMTSLITDPGASQEHSTRSWRNTADGSIDNGVVEGCHFREGPGASAKQAARHRRVENPSANRCMGILNRIVNWSDKGITLEADPRHVDLATLQELTLAATQRRSIAARCNFLAPDRPDIQYACRKISRKMSAPTSADWSLLKKLGRYLRSYPRMLMNHGHCRHRSRGLQTIWLVDKRWLDLLGRSFDQDMLTSGEAWHNGVTNRACEVLGVWHSWRSWDKIVWEKSRTWKRRRWTSQDVKSV